MRFFLFITSLSLLAEFNADVNGEPTVVGCFIRGLDAVDKGRCKGSQ